jgi:hypothetical protein
MKKKILVLFFIQILILKKNFSYPAQSDFPLQEINSRFGIDKINQKNLFWFIFFSCCGISALLLLGLYLMADRSSSPQILRKEQNKLKEKLEEKSVLRQQSEQEDGLKQPFEEEEGLRQPFEEEDGLKQQQIEKDKIDQLRQKQEQDRLQQEQDRLKQDRLEQDRLEQDRLEQDRLQQDRLEQDRLQQDRLEQDRLQQNKKEQNVEFKRKREILMNDVVKKNLKNQEIKIHVGSGLYLKIILEEDKNNNLVLNFYLDKNWTKDSPSLNEKVLQYNLKDNQFHVFNNNYLILKEFNSFFDKIDILPFVKDYCENNQFKFFLNEQNFDEINRLLGRFAQLQDANIRVLNKIEFHNFNIDKLKKEKETEEEKTTMREKVKNKIKEYEQKITNINTEIKKISKKKNSEIAKDFEETKKKATILLNDIELNKSIFLRNSSFSSYNIAKFDNDGLLKEKCPEKYVEFIKELGVKEYKEIHATSDMDYKKLSIEKLQSIINFLDNNLKEFQSFIDSNGHKI